jgi:hypothetical protein
VKGDIGDNAYFSSNFKEFSDTTSVKDKGGLYSAFGTGYEFPFGLVFDITYGIYKSSIEFSVSDNPEIGSGKKKCDLTYSCVGLNVGYKFKI